MTDVTLVRQDPTSTKASELSGVKGWYPWLFESAVGGIVCTGAVCPLITRGPNKGQPNFKKKDPATQSIVIVPSSDELVKEWEDYCLSWRNSH